jgi:hypothetical protein
MDQEDFPLKINETGGDAAVPQNLVGKVWAKSLAKNIILSPILGM